MGFNILCSILDIALVANSLCSVTIIIIFRFPSSATKKWNNVYKSYEALCTVSDIKPKRDEYDPEQFKIMRVVSVELCISAYVWSGGSRMYYY